MAILPKMKCPHAIEPHQIQGLDFIHIYPVVQVGVSYIFSYSHKTIFITIQWNHSCKATFFAPEKWHFKRGGLSSGVWINTFMFRFTLLSGLLRGSGLSSGWPLKRDSTVLHRNTFSCWWKDSAMDLHTTSPGFKTQIRYIFYWASDWLPP